MGNGANRVYYGKGRQTGFTMGKGANRVYYGKGRKQGLLWKFLTLGMYGISAEERAAARRREYGVISKDSR